MTKERKPHWLKKKLPNTDAYAYINRLVKKHQLHTICTSGKCPNIGECWERGTATFMILGDVCTRACKFCNVATGKPAPPDEDEAQKLAYSIHLMGLKHAVITSVDRDDLSDGGAAFWANVIRTVKQKNPTTTLEVLVPDFDGDTQCLDLLIAEKPEVISHNMETVSRLTPQVRSRAKYERSLSQLSYIAESPIVAKSGIMLGLGETRDEIIATMRDMVEAKVGVFTIGQYLQPTEKHLPVKEYVTPEQFEEYKQIGLALGIPIVESSPLVRSSYRAENHIVKK